MCDDVWGGKPPFFWKKIFGLLYVIKLWYEQGDCGILYFNKERILCENLKFI